MDQKEEKKNKRKAMFITAGIQVLLLLIVIFVVAWRAPNPPIPEYGIELNFGLQNTGSGDIQPLNNEENQVEQVQEEESTPPVEETAEETPIPEAETTPVEETETQVPDTEVQEVIPETVTESNSPDVIPPKEETKPKEVKETEKPKKDPVEETPPAKTPVEEIKKPKEEPVKEAETKPVTPEAGKSREESTPKNSEESNTSEGNGNTSDKGDQGDEEGSVDNRSLMGSPGSSKGSSLEMSGWKWDNEPKPADKSQESGKIVFEITIDDEGYLTGIKVIEKSVTPAVVQVYKEAVQKLTFSKNSDYKPAASSKGRITFIIKAK